MGRKSRKRQSEASGAAKSESTIKRGYARGEERNQAIREGLEPLAPGERPTAVTVAAIVALLLAIANGVATALGETIDNDATFSNVAFSVILLVAAAGMWKAKYWAVLGFEALLGIQVTLSVIAAMFAATVVEALVLSVAALLGGWLFWKLVRAMARLQMPERRPKPPVI
jgi:hypothetical protein